MEQFTIKVESLTGAGGRIMLKGQVHPKSSFLNFEEHLKAGDMVAYVEEKETPVHNGEIAE